jgi:DNA-binding NtrC family response regulator
MEHPLPSASVLIVDDEEIQREVLRVLLEEEGYTVRTAADGKEALALSERQAFEVVISDIHMEPVGGLELLRRLRDLDPEVLVVLMTAYGSVESAVTALRGGAYDYITKPFKDDEVKVTVRNAVRHRSLARENVHLREVLRDRYDFDNIVGRSEAMMQVFALIRKVSRSTANVLISGPSGTGKELVARSIHYNSPRCDRPFVTVNCSAIPDTLFESEMFGHVKGAFTGAVSLHKGVFEEANGGTLFLDEIGDLSLFAQAKLLRAIQEGEIRPVGGAKTLSVDVRIISATNKDLEREVGRAQFREDLYYRVNVVQLKLPRLADRKEDVAALAYHFLNRYSQRLGGTVQRVSREAMALLTSYGWPGNVRQLENVMERAVILAEGNTIEVQDLPEDLRLDVAPKAVDLDAGPLSLDQLLQDYEVRLIEQALERCGGNISRAAELLGIHRRTLSSRIQRYGIKGGHVEEGDEEST